jgi:hypothetical protein
MTEAERAMAQGRLLVIVQELETELAYRRDPHRIAEAKARVVIALARALVLGEKR